MDDKYQTVPHHLYKNARHDGVSAIVMIMLFHNVFLLLSICLVHAASIVARSESYPLASNVIGAKTNLIISNAYIAPDGFNRS